MKKRASAEARNGLSTAILQDEYYSGRGCAIFLELDDKVLDALISETCSASTWSSMPPCEQPRTGTLDKSLLCGSSGKSKKEDEADEVHTSLEFD